VVQRASPVSGDARFGGYGAPAVPTILALYEGDVSLVEDLGAMNRWPDRTTLGLQQYLERWQASCAEKGRSGHLPQRLQELLV
jgi:hypothetical protein